MVKGHRKALESLYLAVCNIYAFIKEEDEFELTDQTEQLIYENKKCRVSYKNISAANQTESFATTAQEIKLFIAPELLIPPGSTIEVTQNNRTEKYKSSGKAAVYTNHQEIILNLYEERA
ncbi:Uncharacterised protein [Sebaldella termitidis]|uniref:Phage protein n=1 Tax=Sebaldella termitidis (strain ATCC 33386 / NCTC 11300) TaxID=526218 RepID=D1AHR1_SEBTE|nr:hypothetical protein [Sebaldella termitidis]ACZ08295.1 hypothetical protein Sterm_1433 [Sebaldella termitidis ATCC 33386]SUI23605.1 Uncharacterised protein [Sebaldella termitidis]